jgi:hypothetical protein
VSDSDRLQRRSTIVLVVAVLAAVVVSLATDGERTRRALVESMASRSLDELALLAGLRDDTGESLRGEPLPVAIVQDGGSTWIREAVADAVEVSPDFAEADSRHLLRIESVQTESAIGLQLRLWREGWELRSPELMRGRVSPWVAVLAAGLGAAVAFWLWRVGPGLLVAGGLAQAVLALLPWPAESIPPTDWLTDVRSGPLLAPLAGLTGSTWVTPVALAVIAFCVVLVAFDHRRSREREDSLKLSTAGGAALMAAAGSLTWLEAALRAGLWASMHSIAGMLAVVLLAVAWVPAIHRARERLRA